MARRGCLRDLCGRGVCGYEGVVVSSYQIDLVTRYVPLSVFAEVARGVAGEIAGGMDGVVLCVCVFVCGVHSVCF